jgi:hypothetical protein
MKLIGYYGLTFEQLRFMFQNKKCYVLFYSIDNSARTQEFEAI